jgi:hypothetical protein
VVHGNLGIEFSVSGDHHLQRRLLYPKLTRESRSFEKIIQYFFSTQKTGVDHGTAEVGLTCQGKFCQAQISIAEVGVSAKVCQAENSSEQINPTLSKKLFCRWSVKRKVQGVDQRYSSIV